MSQHSALSPDWVIDAVPADVWRYTFGIFYHDSSSKTSAMEIVRLSHVCSLWRKIVNGAPELWTNNTLQVVRCPKTDEVWGRWAVPNAELFFHVDFRSPSAMPLTLALEPQQSSRTPPSVTWRYWRPLSAIKSFLSAAAQARELKMDMSILSDFLWDEFQACQGIYGEDEPMENLFTLGKLENLILDLGSHRDYDEYGWRLWKEARRLRCVSFYGTKVDWYHIDSLMKNDEFPFHQLTTLTMTTDIETFFYVLSLTPLLVNATFYLSEWLGLGPQHIHLHALQDLTLHAILDEHEGESEREDEDEEEDEDEDEGAMMRILDFVTAPAMKRLSLCFWGHRWSLGAFEEFVNGPTPLRLERLQLDVTSGTQEDKLKCLQMLPFLQTLHLTREHHGKAVNTDKYIGEAFWSAMQDWKAGTGEFVLCPNLQEITVAYGALSRTARTTFAKMIEERWRRSAEGKGFGVVITDARELMETEKEAQGDLGRLLRLKESGFNLRFEPTT